MDGVLLMSIPRRPRRPRVPIEEGVRQFRDKLMGSVNIAASKVGEPDGRLALVRISVYEYVIEELNKILGEKAL